MFRVNSKYLNNHKIVDFIFENRFFFSVDDVSIVLSVLETTLVDLYMVRNFLLSCGSITSGGVHTQTCLWLRRLRLDLKKKF